MATLPAYNPEIPYLGLIPGGIRQGTMIRIKGTMQYGGQRFTISLQTGPALRPRDDTALQLSVRPTEQVIVRNHYENNVWGTEERFGGCPIYVGGQFEILISVEPIGYKVSINGNHFCHFHHRFSMYRVAFIAVESDVSVTSITMEGTDTHPTAPPVPPPMPVPIQPYPPNITYPGIGYPHRPHFPHYPHYPHYPHHPGHGHHPHIPGPPPPPPPPYSPTPYPGHRYAYAHPSYPTATPPSAYSWQADPNYLRRKNKNNAIKYAAVAAGVGSGVGLGAFALSRAFSSSGNDGGDDGGDAGGDDGGFE